MRIQTSSKKKQALNLNVYRNLHFRSLSSQKNKFFKIAEKLLKRIPPLGVVTLHYTVCPSSKGRLDIMNVGSIVDKYFSDAMTTVGVVEDDDYTHITDVSFEFGGIVKEEYVLVVITETKRRKGALPMRVLLDEQDIHAALTTYVEGLNLPNASGVKLEARGDLITAEITFNDDDDDDNTDSSEDKEETPKPRRKRRTKAQMAADKGAADVDETVPNGTDNSSAGDAGTSESETPTPTNTPEKSTSSKNLFGDEESPSSEDDGKADTTAPSDTPPPIVTKPKGSIFDS